RADPLARCLARRALPAALAGRTVRERRALDGLPGARLDRARADRVAAAGRGCGLLPLGPDDGARAVRGGPGRPLPSRAADGPDPVVEPDRGARLGRVVRHGAWRTLAARRARGAAGHRLGARFFGPSDGAL